MIATRARGLTFTRAIGAGGEAEIYEVAERPGSACKHYRQPTRERIDKLRVMLEHPPDGAHAGGHVSIAWPTELVHGDGDQVVGFLMPRIDVRSATPVFNVYNPATRMRIAPGFSWRYLVRTARNIAAIVDSVHRAGHVIGDLNESNFLVDRRALVTLVDCDSMQIADPSTGRLYPSPVGKPEFLAPELQGRDLSTVERTEASDVFALGVLVHQLLLEGLHPHAGVWRGRGDPPDVSLRIRRGWVAGRRGWSPVDRPPHAVPPSALPADVKRLLRRSLSRRPSQRPGAIEWVDALEDLDGSLRDCARSAHHLHAGRGCPWCARIDRGLPDPFPGPGGVSTLTPRGPSLLSRARSRGAAGARFVANVVARVGRGTWIPVAAAAGFAGWTWPVMAPVVIAVVVLPLAYSALTPSRHVIKAVDASARTFVTSAAASAGVSAMFLEWPVVVRVASALAAVVHGVVLPTAVEPWTAARARLRRVPWPLPWLLAAAAGGAWQVAGW